MDYIINFGRPTNNKSKNKWVWVLELNHELELKNNSHFEKYLSYFSYDFNFKYLKYAYTGRIDQKLNTAKAALFTPDAIK